MKTIWIPNLLSQKIVLFLYKRFWFWMHTISRTYRFMALFLAALIFITSVGFTVDMHYCGGQLKSFSFIGKAKSCHEKAMVQCPHHKKMMAQSKDNTVDTKNCCNNKTLHFQADQDKQIQHYDFQLNQPLQHFVKSLVRVFFTNRVVEKETPAFAHYKPPLISRDIPVLIQSFLL